MWTPRRESDGGSYDAIEMEHLELLLGLPLWVFALLGAVRLPAWWRQPMGVQGVPPGPRQEAAAQERRGHPGPREYVGIGLALAVVTAVEVAVYYLDALEDVLVPTLLVLSATKFSLVVLWFMHLKFDSRLFSALFLGGLMMVAGAFVVVLATFGASLV